MFHKHINRRRAISVDGLDPTKLPQSWGGHNDNNNNTNNVMMMMTMIKRERTFSAKSDILSPIYPKGGEIKD